MRHFCGLLTAALTLAMVGCQPKGDSQLHQVSENESGGKSTTQPPEIDPEKAQEWLDKAREPSDDVNIKEKPDAWSSATESAPEIKKSIGQKIDDAFAEMPPAYVKVEMEISDKGSILRSTPIIKIQDENRFSIEYTLPETKAAINSISSDGKERVQLEDGKITKLPPLGETKRSNSKMSRSEIEEFAVRMPYEGFSYFADGKRPWSALVEGLKDPKNGFTYTVEEMKAKPVGEDRPFYRVMAESKKGPELLIEFVIDSERNVPVVFRTNMKYADGKERKMVWRANWAFGGSHAKDDFKNPLPPKKA